MINKTASRTSWKTEEIDLPWKITVNLLFTGRQFKLIQKLARHRDIEDLAERLENYLAELSSHD